MGVDWPIRECADCRALAAGTDAVAVAPAEDDRRLHRAHFRDRVVIAERLQNTDPEAARLLTAAEKRSRELEAEVVRLRADLADAIAGQEQVSAYASDREAHIEELTAEVVRLREALAPILRQKLWRDTYPDGPDILDGGKLLTPDEVRRARQAVRQGGNDDD
jgi:hypothetical protein